MRPWYQIPRAKDCGWAMPLCRPSEDAPQESVAIIGAGLAGLCAAYALVKKGFCVTVYEAANDCAAGASASPAGIVKPYVTRQPSDAMRFHREAYRTLFRWLPELEHQGGFIPCGALQLIDKPYPVYSANSANQTNQTNPEAYDAINNKAGSALSGVTLDQQALHFKHAGWLPVYTLCRALLNDVQNRGGHFIARHTLQTLIFNTQTNAWDLTFEQRNAHGKTVCQTHTHRTVILASGESLSRSQLLPKHTLIPARGQLTEFARTFALNTVVSGNQYAIPSSNTNTNSPSDNTLWIGATFERDNANAAPTDADDAANQASANDLLPHLTQPVMNPINRFAAVRCTTLDRLPIVGPLPVVEAAQSIYQDIRHGKPSSTYPAPEFHPGLAVIGGLGSRGIALAPYAAELLVDWLTGGAQLETQNRLVSPLRFLIRQLKRQQ